MKLSGKQITECLYKEVLDHEGEHMCRKCNQVKKSPKGCTNLVSHAKLCYGDDMEEKFKQHLQASGHIFEDNGQPGRVEQKNLRTFFTNNQKEEGNHNWMRWIANRNQPLLEVENKMTHDMFKNKPMAVKTLRKLILGTTNEAMKPISEELRKAGRFTLIVDGWTCDGTSTHDIAIFAGFINPKTDEHEEVLIAIQPALNEEDMGAEAHIALLESTLEMHGLDRTIVICFICDNCNTNSCVSKLWDIPMVGCASHCFNLAVKLWISNIRGLEDAIAYVATLMGKACNIKLQHDFEN